jgi:mono/diheme cytochrome c family protein
MKNGVIATLLVAFVVVLLLSVYITKSAKVVAQPAPAVMETSKVSAESAPAVMETSKVSAESAPAVTDMSLPMPLGLKGDPEKGKIFFMGNCFTCHGVQGDGNGPRAYFITPPPRNFLLEASRQRLNRPVLFEAITNGRLGTNMPAWGKVLSNQEIANFAEFVFQNFISPPQGNKGNQG